jgi:hypothetical protein
MKWDEIKESPPALTPSPIGRRLLLLCLLSIGSYSSVHLGENFPTSVATRKSTTALTHFSVESCSALTQEDDELSVHPKRRENYELIYERERKKTQCRLPKPEPNAVYQCRALLLAMGAGEADRGKQGRQGQARPTGASEADGGK